jgi:hypothetical protein
LLVDRVERLFGLPDKRVGLDHFRLESRLGEVAGDGADCAVGIVKGGDLKA